MRKRIALGALILSILLSAAFPAIIARGLWIVHRSVAINWADVVQNQSDFAGAISPGKDRIEQMDFAGGTVIHIGPTAIALFLPFVLIIAARLIDSSVKGTQLWNYSLLFALLALIPDWVLLTS